MSMTESRFLHHAVLLCVGVQVLKFWLDRFHQILEDLCALQLLFMVDATRRHAGRTTPPLPAPRRRRNHLA